ncbi:hypothetical protein PVAND_013169 [Polypedilum vanderplanki]|uniref:Tubulin-specific chaperone D n=1 Tax=Polypedilum vanderplanki TaxID=319348 RepID=A0A9J6CPV3_POLVA|nr:hypothetical protein PVAND_013169 [Polypedilum vanderplanki]
MVQIEEFKDDEAPSNTLEYFSEYDEVAKMIDELSQIYEKNLEKSYEKYSEILSRYQEQPHLLDSHIIEMINSLLDIIRDSKTTGGLMHASFKYLYQICKVRTFKVFVKFLPHELSDIDFVLNILEQQDIDDSTNWETRYCCLLWMSILVLNPFHMSRLDAMSEGDNSSKTKMERIYQICKSNCKGNDSCSVVAAYLSAKFLIRNEIKDIYLSSFFDWTFNEVKQDDLYIRYGTLLAIAAILKHGKREDLLPHAPKILSWILVQDFKDSSDFLKNKYYVKIIQRLGLVFMAPKIAAWRYNRGSRSLQENLSAKSDNSVEFESTNITQEDPEDVDVPDEIEEIVEQLLHGLKSPSSDVRWLAAKGIGRITNRLPKSLGDEVVGSVIEILNPLEQHEAWHGACLAVAELSKRGLLLPYRLEHLVPLLLQALIYDEMKGYMSVGQNIRDAACYVCWAFARAYDPQDLQPFVQKIATGLLIVTVFDREINCRRAASAAFQESVGRLGNFPHGIDILTTADFYTVGLRVNSYMNISDFIAQYDEYTIPLIDHLVEIKTAHWDTAIRELTAKTLNKLTNRNVNYMAQTVLNQLINKTDSIDVNVRHGSVMSIGEIILALNNIDPLTISNEIMSHLNNLIIKFQTREQFRGMSGELMKMAALDFIKNCSEANLQVNNECIDSWQCLIDSCITSKTNRIRELAVSALSTLCPAYYEQNDNKLDIVRNYLKGSNNDLEEHVRMGYVLAIGAFPHFMLLPLKEEILEKLIELSLVPNEMKIKQAGLNPIILIWSEARRDSVKALGNITMNLGFNNLSEDNLNKIFDCLLKALEEYTIDNRGDIGAWVREASMNVLYQLIINCPSDRLDSNVIHKVMTGFAQQSVEKIDRTRGIAGKLFHNLVYHEPSIPHIQRHDSLKKIFPEDGSKILWLFADHTFPLFCNLLELEEYSEKVLTGLVASIGQLTESLIKYSSSSFLDFLNTHPNEITRICNLTLKIFQDNLLNERITYPLLNFLDTILSSGTLLPILDDENSTFPDEVFRLVNLEIKGHKKLYKLVSSINVMCQLIQVRRLCPKIFTKMGIFLGLTHVHIRKSAALKLYEAMLLYGDTTDVPEENLEELLNTLMDTDWTLPLNEIRPIRNHVCDLLNVKAPVAASTLKT